MTFRDDFPGEMEEFPAEIADLVHVARRAGSADELVGEAVIVGRIAAAMGEHAAPPQRGAHERIAVLQRFRTAKVTAGATAVLLLLGGTAAAAATGSLPTPAHHHHAALAAAPTIAAPRHHEVSESGVSGVVASVNGVATPGTCGASGLAGTFTLTQHADTFTVNVDTTTTFAEKNVVGPTFANVCVGSKVHADGVVAGTTVTATAIKIKPPRTGVSGVVASVNGVTTAGTCGTAGTAGAFTLTAHKHNTFMVNVDTTTTYTEDGVASPSFANVCVGAKVKATGMFVDTTVTATAVLVVPAKHDDGDKPEQGDQPDQPEKHDGKHGFGPFGTVASVNGLTTAGVCGAPGATGTFTVTGHDGTTFTINVTGSTMFKVPSVSDPTFGNVCVGEKVGAKGDVSGTTVAATDVFVFQSGGDDHHHGHKGHDHGDHHKSGDDSGDSGHAAPAVKLSSDHHNGGGHDGNHHHDG